MSVAETAVRLLRKHGEAMTLKRAGETDLAIVGKRIPGVLVETGGSAAQQQFEVKISTGELAASDWASKTPRRSDSLVIGGRVHTVRDAIPLGDVGAVVLYRLTVDG